MAIIMPVTVINIDNNQIIAIMEDEIANRFCNVYNNIKNTHMTHNAL